MLHIIVYETCERCEVKKKNTEYKARNIKTNNPVIKIGCAILTVEKVLEIRRLLGIGVKQKRIAKYFNVGPSTISDINTRRTWKHI